MAVRGAKLWNNLPIAVKKTLPISMLSKEI